MAGLGAGIKEHRALVQAAKTNDEFEIRLAAALMAAAEAVVLVEFSNGG